MNPTDLMDFWSSSSSSSSSESEGDHLEPILAEILQHTQKNELYAEHIIPLYTEKEFLMHFKVPRNILSSLAIELSNSEYYPKKDTGFKRISAEKCMWVFCWYATHEAASFRDVADRFNIALSTLHLIIQNVSLFLSYKSNMIITWPCEEERRDISEDFRQMGFPDVIGCLDGSHVKIDKPENDPDSYLNRKKYYSIQFQVVCDSNRKIRDVFIGYPGSVHDARVFKNSPLYQSLPVKCGDKCILADSAYPCLRTVLTPYRDNGNLHPMERNYNTKLSHCRILIEHTFGILKQKFRALYHIKLRNISTICHFIRACCVLHNLTRDVDEVMENEEAEIAELPLHDMDIRDDEFDDNNVAGHNFRNYIAAVLFNQ